MWFLKCCFFEKDHRSSQFFTFLDDNQPPFSCSVCPTKPNIQNCWTWIVCKIMRCQYHTALAVYRIWRCWAVCCFGAGEQCRRCCSRQSINPHTVPLLTQITLLNYIRAISSFCFKIDAFNHTHSLEEQRAIIESFSYVGFGGPVHLRNSEQTFVVHEFWTYEHPRKLKKVYLGRYVRTLCFPFLTSLAREGLSRVDDKIWFKAETLHWQYFVRGRIVSNNC